MAFVTIIILLQKRNDMLFPIFTLKTHNHFQILPMESGMLVPEIILQPPVLQLEQLELKSFIAEKDRTNVHGDIYVGTELRSLDNKDLTVEIAVTLEHEYWEALATDYLDFHCRALDMAVLLADG